MLPRERATQAEDLPHKFEGRGVAQPCEFCGFALLEPRHVAWEKAAMAHPAGSTLPRETGV